MYSTASQIQIMSVRLPSQNSASPIEERRSRLATAANLPELSELSCPRRQLSSDKSAEDAAREEPATPEEAPEQDQQTPAERPPRPGAELGAHQQAADGLDDRGQRLVLGERPEPGRHRLHR